uniref:HotDog ACOT-type domain-containing protein n=1 Tax=Mola mola TaxID=94237 RepID=A0A3Q3WS51_MOLML
MEERVLLSSMVAKSQSDLPAKTMKDSYLEVHLPLGSDPQLREKYLTYYNTVRFGRILEDLDSLADIFMLFPYCTDMRHHIIYPDCDIKFTGHVSWVGKTSIEAKMHMSQGGVCKPTET